MISAPREKLINDGNGGVKGQLLPNIGKQQQQLEVQKQGRVTEVYGGSGVNREKCTDSLERAGVEGTE